VEQEGVMSGRITMEEIARLAGVSKATVSRVVNGKEGVGDAKRTQIQNLLEELKYDMDSNLPVMAARMRLKTVALIIPDITNPFFGEMARAIGTRMNEKGYSLLLGDSLFSTEMEGKWIRDFVSKKVDGIIIAPVGDKPSKDFGLMDKFHIPCVFLDNYLEGVPNKGIVTTDNELAVYMACEHFFYSGVKKIAFISGKGKSRVAGDRLKGYRTAMTQFGIPFEKELVRAGDYTVSSGYKAILEMESAGLDYSAVICANDLMALGAINALKELSYRIPEDVQVIGYDNMFFSQYITPALSTIQHPIIEMGRIAADFMLQALEDKSEAYPFVKLKTRLLLRQTTR